MNQQTIDMILEKFSYDEPMPQGFETFINSLSKGEVTICPACHASVSDELYSDIPNRQQTEIAKRMWIEFMEEELYDMDHMRWDSFIKWLDKDGA